MLLPSPIPGQKRKAATVAIFVGFFIPISSFAYPTFFAVSSTPYDRQMNRVYPTLASSSAKSSGSLSLDEVNGWMAALRAMPYEFSPYWQTPTEVILAQTGDCKGKAVALYAQMVRHGAKYVRVVIGKRHIYHSSTHAWLEWDTSAGSYMLDPTFNEFAVRTAELDPMTYVPFYAFDAEHKYQASRSTFVGTNTRVATGYGDRLYVPPAPTYYAQPSFTGFGSPQFSAPTPNYAVTNTQYRQTAVPNSQAQSQSATQHVARPVSKPPPVLSQTLVYHRPNVNQTQMTTQVRLASTPNTYRIVHSTSNSARSRHVRYVAHHRKRSTQSKRLASS